MRSILAITLTLTTALMIGCSGAPITESHTSPLTNPPPASTGHGYVPLEDTLVVSSASFLGQCGVAYNSAYLSYLDEVPETFGYIASEGIPIRRAILILGPEITGGDEASYFGAYALLVAQVRTMGWDAVEASPLGYSAASPVVQSLRSAYASSYLDITGSGATATSVTAQQCRSIQAAYGAYNQ